MPNLIRKAILFSFCVFYTLLALYKLLILYVTKFSSQPWKPKDHSNTPACLTDPKYGVHKFAKVNGVRIHYVEAGDPNKPLMLFVHGFPEFWYSWRHQIPEFSKDYWTVAFDLRGYNLSDKPDGVNNYKIGTVVEDIRALIEYLNRKQCILVCHDWGTIIGWQFLTKYKFMVQKYVIMGAPPRGIFSQLFRDAADQFKRSWYIIFFQMPIVPELAVSAEDYSYFFALWKNKFNENFTEDDLEAYKHMLSLGSVTGGINYYRANFSGGVDANSGVKETLDGSDGMFVLGEHEKYISLKSLQLAAKQYPKMRVETVPNANHFLHQDNPKGTNELLWNFIGPASNYPVERFN